MRCFSKRIPLALSCWSSSRTEENASVFFFLFINIFILPKSRWSEKKNVGHVSDFWILTPCLVLFSLTQLEVRCKKILDFWMWTIATRRRRRHRHRIQPSWSIWRRRTHRLSAKAHWRRQRWSWRTRRTLTSGRLTMGLISCKSCATIEIHFR